MSDMKVKKSLPVRVNRSLIRFLSQPLLLEEGGPPKLLGQFIIVVVTIFTCVGIWAISAQISERSSTRGSIVPAGNLHVVQHLEGGIISEILIDNGEIVKKGDLLLRLDETVARGELEQLKAREAGLALRAERLEAFVLGRSPDFNFAKDYPDLVNDQKAILALQLEALKSQKSVLQSRIEQRDSETKSLVNREQNIKKQIVITNEQVELHRNLYKKGIEARASLLDVERSLTQVTGELLLVQGDIIRSREAKIEAQNSLIELEANLRNDSLLEMGSVTAELAEVREAKAKLIDRVSRLEITAPTDGIIKGLATRTISAVIGPGDVLMEIVPLSEKLIAEIEIQPKDVGHLKIGQPAKIKITSYDVSRFGNVSGVLTHISASTFQDEEGEPFYKGRIDLDKNYVGNNPERNLILPGMVLDADINTGERTVMQYLLKPIYRALDSSFGER
ncbi:HlyD family type I secretion periplasmic adaptor subunit [Kiloniella sp. EL199]|uniref:HlyD family type I secretion periplasmic adaptor subunit n=1 Tax=Kiloniella sp. EL199 TaxID=2107581 RepID=UPI000EA10E04|nr:HlyD family type I secretion periplasmic adaptor subunit [Kiloniella sp. EL199]